MKSIEKEISKGRVIFISLFICFLSEFTIRFILALSYVPETGGASLDVLYGIVRMLSGRPLYTNPELPPYAVIGYMPLHYYVVAGVSQLFGVGQSIHDVSALNRVINLLFNVSLFIPVHRIIKNIFEIRDRLTVWSVFFAVFIFIYSADYSGPGSFYLLVLMFSIYYFLCFLKLHSNKYGSELVLSGIFGALACFTNQFGFIIQIASVLFLWLKMKDKKATIRYALSSVLSYLFLSIILIGSSYNYWLRHLFNGLFHFDLISFGETDLYSFVIEIAYLLAITGITLSFFPRIKFDWWFVFLRFLILFIFTITVTGRLFFGLSIVYFESGLMLAILLFSVIICNYPDLKATSRVLLLCGSVIFILNIYQNKTWEMLRDIRTYSKQYDDCAFVAGYVKQNVKNDEYIFALTRQDNFMNTLIGEKALFPNKKLAMSKYYNSKSLRYDDFRQRLKEGKIKYLIGENDNQPAVFLDEAFVGFEKESRSRGYSIFILKASK